ncbi:MAG TPA: hypothetical protein VHD56_11300 [Tepidisphaeraceae bacterium]|nr:hypothetical protein [Tepidisphaeraceae bacterium]
MNRITQILAFTFAFCAVAAAQTTKPAQLAFPGAEGFGAFAQGGRGGKVIFVTNLEDSGPGSLRAACETSGPRTILFRVSGTIMLKNRLTIREPFVTIAGQSAPGDGICVGGFDTLVQTHDVILRHVRFRAGDLAPGERDALSLMDTVNAIVDHCSASWSIDEGLSTTKASKNVTVQWCFITEALHNSNHFKGNHGFGGIMQGEAFSYHHNLYAHNRSRNPRPETGYHDFRNNVIYDWNAMAGYAEDNGFRMNYVANYLKAGPSTLTGREFAFHTGKQRTFMYANGNVLEGVVAEGQDDRKIINVRNGGNMVDKPFDFAPVKTDTATVAYERVLKEAGATLPKRDPVDTRIVETVRNGTGKQIDSQKDVGGWPELKSAQPAPDADNDGLADAWETAHRLDPHNAADGNQDSDSDGYTNLEEFLNNTDPMGTDAT